MHMAGNYRISLAAVMNGASALGLLDNAISKRHFDFCFILFYPEKNMFWHFMQIVSLGDNLYETTKPIFWEK